MGGGTRKRPCAQRPKFIQRQKQTFRRAREPVKTPNDDYVELALASIVFHVAAAVIHLLLILAVITLSEPSL
jgi:hypothetical protein